MPTAAEQVLQEELDFGYDHIPTPTRADEDKLRMEKEELDAHAAAKDKEEAEETDVKSAKDTDTSLDDEDKSQENKEADDKRSKVIPRERFDKAQAKAKAREEALQARIAELETQTTAVRSSEDIRKLQAYINDLEDKYEEAVLEGKRDEAKTFRRELSQYREVLSDAKAQYSTEAVRREALSEVRYDAALARAEADHPVLNPDSDEYDESITEEVGVLLESFVLRGFTRDVALQKAVKYVVGPVARADGDRKDVQKVADERATTARKKAADAMKRQPASLNNTGLDFDRAGSQNKAKVDINRLTQEKFAKLDEDTLAELRGDTL